jgi:hypothetical protein
VERGEAVWFTDDKGRERSGIVRWTLDGLTGIDAPSGSFVAQPGRVRRLVPVRTWGEAAERAEQARQRTRHSR